MDTLLRRRGFRLAALDDEGRGKAARAGHSADGWREVLVPVIARYRGIVKRLYFRGDAVFANPEMCEFLEAKRAGYTIRLPANSVLEDRLPAEAPGRATVA